MRSSQRGHKTALTMTIVVVIVAISILATIDSKSQEMIVALTAVVGAMAIWFQMKRAKDMAEGEFILTLNESFSSNPDIKALYAKLESGGELSDRDRTAIVQYLTLFETIYLLVKRDVVEISLIDDLFRYRFFIATNHPQIQQLELAPDARFYHNLYSLHHLWRQHLKKNRTGEPSIGVPLQEACTDYEAHVS